MGVGLFFYEGASWNSKNHLDQLCQFVDPRPAKQSLDSGIGLTRQIQILSDDEILPDCFFRNSRRVF